MSVDQNETYLPAIDRFAAWGQESRRISGNFSGNYSYTQTTQGLLEAV